MGIDSILNRLEKVRRTGPGKWTACCPAHDDKCPSLGIKQADDDKILIHCFGGCDVQSIVASVGLELSDLMPPKPQGYDHTRSRAPRFSKSEMFDRVVFEATILRLAISQLLIGASLAPDDLKRISQAEALIDDVVKECGR